MANDDARTQLIERAKADAATLARTSADSVQVVSVDAVDWSDASLGCPKAGMMYAGRRSHPATKSSWKTGGRTYEFHSGLNPTGPLVRCEG